MPRAGLATQQPELLALGPWPWPHLGEVPPSHCGAGAGSLCGMAHSNPPVPPPPYSLAGGAGVPAPKGPASLWLSYSVLQLPRHVWVPSYAARWYTPRLWLSPVSGGTRCLRGLRGRLYLTTHHAQVPEVWGSPTAPQLILEGCPGGHCREEHLPLPGLLERARRSGAWSGGQACCQPGKAFPQSGRSRNFLIKEQRKQPKRWSTAATVDEGWKGPGC